MRTPRPHRGFTLIELMIVVAIIGILASVAIPKFNQATLRARKSERDLIMTGVAKGMQDYILRNGAAAGIVTGAWNPPLPVTTQRRSFAFGQPGWKEMDLQVQGHLFHSYQFVLDANASPATLVAAAQGDLDGDGDICDRTVTFEITRGGMFLQSDVFDAQNVY